MTDSCNGLLIEYPDSAALTRKLFSICVASLEDLGKDTNLPQPYFACLLALDARAVRDEVISRAASFLLDNGLVAHCAWGPDCTRVETLFDMACVGRELAGELDYLVMTTSHEGEPLDEALWFLLHCAWGSESDGDKCLVITVGNSEWDAQVRRRLSDVEGLVNDVVPDTGDENPSGGNKRE